MIEKIKQWTERNYLQIAFFNLFVMLLVVFRSAGYFGPFFLISVNFIILVSLILSVVLFKLKSSFMFTVSILFLIFAALIRFFEVDIWAERTAIYSFQAFFVGLLLLIFESIFQKQN